MKNTFVYAVLFGFFVATSNGVDSRIKLRLKEQEQFLKSVETVLNGDSADLFRESAPGVNRFAMRAEAFTNFSDAMQVDPLSRAVLPGIGVDVRNLPADKSLAFNLSTYPAPTPVQGSLEVEYYHSAAEVVRSVGGGTNLEASLITSYFSVGGSFKSSSMQTNQSQTQSGYLILKFAPQYEFVPIQNETITSSARHLAEHEGLKAFYEKYGTHFVSSARPSSLYTIIYTFHADSENSLRSFESEVGINVGIMNVFGVGFGNTVKTALSNKTRQVSFTFREYYSSSAGIMPLPPFVAPQNVTDPYFYLLDPANLVARYNTFLQAMATAKVPYTQVKLRPFLELLDPAKAANLPSDLIVMAISVGTDIDDILSDYNTMLQAPGVWSSAPAPAMALALSEAKHGVNVAVLEVLNDPKQSNRQKLSAAVLSAVQLATAFFNNSALWPEPGFAQLRALTAGTGGAAHTLDFGFKVDRRLGKPVVKAVGVQGTTAGEVLPTNLDLIKDSEVTENGVVYNIWKTGNVSLTPVANVALRVILVDAAGRVREAIIFSSGDPLNPQTAIGTWVEMY